MWTRLAGLASRVRFLLARHRLCDEFAHELSSHLELLTARYIRTGMTADEARLAARRQVGNVMLVREDIYRMNSIRWLDVLVHDLRDAFRIFARSPALATVVIATLALGIGANGAIFSVVYSVLLKPLPYAQPEELYSAEVVVPEQRDQIPSMPLTVQAYLEWRNQRTVFSGIGALRPWECNLTGGGEPERLGGARVSANFFSLLGVPVARGRHFAAEEEQPGNERVVVISDALWRRRYGADATLIGRTVVINGESHQVVGIAPPSLLVPTGTLLHPLLPFAPRIDIWKPIAPTVSELENESWDHGVLVRLPPGASLEQGRQQLETILRELIRAQVPGLKTEPIIQFAPIREIYTGNVRLRLLLILAASALLLLTACASIANLFLARVASRSNELATRIALGAGRGRIMSQTMTESLLLAVCGGAIAAVLATYGGTLLAAYGPDDVRLLADTRLHLPLFLFATVVSLFTGLVCGLVPAWQAYRKDARAQLQESSRTSIGGRRAERSRHLPVAVEMALATMLLASAALLLHSFVKVMRADRGYAVDQVLTVDLSLFGERYATGPGRTAFYSELAGNVRALPGVQAVGGISDLPAVSASTGGSRRIFYATDADFQRLVLTRPVAMIRSVTTGYFAASGTPLRAGRLFIDEEDVAVAVISESLARRMWPREDLPAVVGRRFRQGDVTGPRIAVIGVVEDARSGAVDREPPPVIYRPHEQWASGPMTLVVRTVQEPQDLAPAVRAEIRKMDPNLPIPALRTMRDIVSATVAQRRFQMTLTSLFALVALLLGAVGLYGVVSYSVACRTRDIGLRIALGALNVDIMHWIFAHGMRPVLIGLAAGLGGAIAVASVLRSLLFGITPVDPLSLALVSLMLLLTSSVACYLPARRAAALDPITALRHE